MKLGYALTGSFCTISSSLKQLSFLAEEHEVIPIVSYSVRDISTRFSSSEENLTKLTKTCGTPPIQTVRDAEPLGPETPLDALIIAPCTGNTLAKLANGITDTPVTMAAKAHLRCDRPLIIALATNDALSQNLKNIGTLMTRKSVYFVPFAQDSPISKPYSLVCDFSLIPETLEKALKREQIQPILRENRR